MTRIEFHKPTSGQFAKVRELLDEIAELDADVAATWRRELNLARERGQFTFTAASNAIGDLIDAKRTLVRKAKAAQTATSRPIPDVPKGRYAVENSEGVLRFYRIRRAANGHTYGAVYASDQEHELPFPALLSVLEAIVKVGVREAQARFGQEIGRCGRCYATLTDETSRAIGLGPECAQK